MATLISTYGRTRRARKTRKPLQPQMRKTSDLHSGVTKRNEQQGGTERSGCELIGTHSFSYWSSGTHGSRRTLQTNRCSFVPLLSQQSTTLRTHLTDKPALTSLWTKEPAKTSHNIRVHRKWVMLLTTGPGRPGRPLCPGRPISPFSPLLPWETEATGIKQPYLHPASLHSVATIHRGTFSHHLINDRWAALCLEDQPEDKPVETEQMHTGGAARNTKHQHLWQIHSDAAWKMLTKEL